MPDLRAGTTDLAARHLQTDMTAGSGNALQACVASMLGKTMEETPNFVTLPSYADGIRDFAGGATKLALPADAAERAALLEPHAGKFCILRGQSPRGAHGHVVVALWTKGHGFAMVHDPHPDATFLDDGSPLGWAMFLG
mmetsp:Transcript_29318/g.90708  ORF Transcript_29318/g.90708 Transcript_29318/m.90708 type:complete len:139 (+) Transcript_29318:1278-1694(+)